MSDYVHSQGYFGKLKDPVGDHHTQEWENLFNFLAQHNLSLNYEGTMIYSNEQAEVYDVGLVFAQPNGAIVFREQCKELGHDVDPVKHYSCTWYNGADSPMADATLKDVFT